MTQAMTMPLHRQQTSRRHARGFTLVEVLIAMAIMVVGLAAVASIYPVAVLQQRRAMDDMNSTIIGQNVLQTLQAVGSDAFAPTGDDQFHRIDRVVFVDGFVSGTQLTSASGAIEFDNTDNAIANGDQVLLINNAGSFSARVAGTSSTAITLDAAAPPNDPSDPAEGFYLVKVIRASASGLPWVPTEAFDRGAINGNTVTPQRRQGYDYFIAYRRRNAGDPADVVIFVARRLSPREQETVAEIRTGGNDKLFSAVIQSVTITGIDDSSGTPGQITGLPSRPVHDPPPAPPAGPEHWSNDLFWADDRNQYVFLYDSGSTAAAAYRVIADGVVDAEPNASLSYDRLLFLPQGTIGITTGVIQ